MANEFRIDINFQGNASPLVNSSRSAVSALEGVESAASKAGRGLGDVSGRFSVLGQGLERFGVSLHGATGGMTGLAAAAARAGPALAAIGAAIATSKFATINAEFQSLRAGLETVLGSAEKAAIAMDSLNQFAASTPFTLQEVTQAFARLAGAGIAPTEKMLVSLGNTAAAKSKPLMQWIEAVTDAMMGETERLKEFDIKASQSADKITFTFRGVSTTVEKDAQSIINYLQKIGETEFAGGMERQSKTISGALSNAEDAISRLVTTLGDSGMNGILTKAINLFTALTNKVNDFVDATRNIGDRTSATGVAGSLTQVKQELEQAGEVLRQLKSKPAKYKESVLVGLEVEEVEVDNSQLIAAQEEKVKRLTEQYVQLTQRSIQLAGGLDSVTAGLQKQETPLDGAIKRAGELEKHMENMGKLNSSYSKAVELAAKKYGVDENLVRAVIEQESQGNPLARSPAGAMGLMQLMPGTARRFGVTDPYNPLQNIEGGVKYLAWLQQYFGGDVTKMLAGYNAGEGNVNKYGGVPPFDETKKYVQTVIALYQRLSQESVALGKADDGMVDSQKKLTAALDPQLDLLDRLYKKRNELVNSASAEAAATATYRQKIQELNAIYEQGALSLDQYRTIKDSLAQSYTDSIARVQEEKDAILASVDATAAAAQEFRKAYDTITRLRDAGEISPQHAQDLIDQQVKSMRERLGEKAQEQIADPMAQLWKDAASGIYDAFVTSFEDIFSAGEKGFKGFAENMKTLFKRLLAQMAAIAVTKNIAAPIIQQVGGALGISPDSIASVLQQMGVAPSQAAGGTAAGGAAGTTGWNWSGGATTGIAAIGGAVAAKAAGGGNQAMAGAAGGAALGAQVGTAVYPGIGTVVGAVIGAVAGGLLGSMAGGGDDEKPTVNIAGGLPASKGPGGYEDYTTSPFGTLGFARAGTEHFNASENAHVLTSLAAYDRALAGFMNPGQIQRVTEAMKDWQQAGTDYEHTANQRAAAIVEASDMIGTGLIDLNQTANEIISDFGTLTEFVDTLLTDDPRALLDTYEGVIARVTSAQRAAVIAVDDVIAAVQTQDISRLASSYAEARDKIQAFYQTQMDLADELYKRVTDAQDLVASIGVSVASKIAGIEPSQASFDRLLSAIDSQQQVFLARMEQAVTPEDRITQAQNLLSGLDSYLSASNGYLAWARQQASTLQSTITSLQNTWASVAESAKSALDALNYSGANPASASERVSLLSGDIARARGEYQSASDSDRAAKAQRLLDLYQHRLSLAQEAFQRPSREYQAIWSETKTAMQALGGEAKQQATVYDQILAATQSTANSGQQTAEQAQAAAATLEATEAANRQRQQEAMDAYRRLQDIIATSAAEQQALASQQLAALTGDTSYQQWSINIQQTQVSMLQSLNDASWAALNQDENATAALYSIRDALTYQQFWRLDQQTDALWQILGTLRGIQDRPLPPATVNVDATGVTVQDVARMIREFAYYQLTGYSAAGWLSAG